MTEEQRASLRRAADETTPSGGHYWCVAVERDSLDALLTAHDALAARVGELEARIPGFESEADRLTEERLEAEHAHTLAERHNDALAAENRALREALEVVRDYFEGYAKPEVTRFDALDAVNSVLPTQQTRRHTLVCRAYGNYQPPYEDCTCGLDTALTTPTRPPEAGECEHFERIADVRGGPEECVACGKTVGQYVPKDEAPKGGPR